MECYAYPTAAVTVVVGGLTWVLWKPILFIAHVVIILAGWVAIATLATTAMGVVAGLGAAIVWMAHRIQDWQARRGGCLTCPHVCNTAQVRAPDVRARVHPHPAVHMRAPDARDMIIRAGARPEAQRRAGSGCVTATGGPRWQALTLPLTPPADTPLTLPLTPPQVSAECQGVNPQVMTDLPWPAARAR